MAERWTRAWPEDGYSAANWRQFRRDSLLAAKRLLEPGYHAL
jgi:hypothetical protein